MLPEMVKKCLSRMSGKLSRTVLRRGQGSNPFSLVDFTSNEYIELIKNYKTIKISMDGKGRATDNIAIERFFRSLKWERLYLMYPENVAEVKILTKEYIEITIITEGIKVITTRPQEKYILGNLQMQLKSRKEFITKNF